MSRYLCGVLRIRVMTSIPLENSHAVYSLSRDLRWYGILNGPKSLFKFGEVRSIVCYCIQGEKMNSEGFTQNGCYDNQPQPFEALFYSIDANSSCSFTKQDSTVK